MGGNATLFSEGSSNAIEPGGLNSAGKDGRAGVLTKARGSHTGVQGWGTYMFAIFVTVWLVLSLVSLYTARKAISVRLIVIWSFG